MIRRLYSWSTPQTQWPPIHRPPEPPATKPSRVPKTTVRVPKTTVRVTKTTVRVTKHRYSGEYTVTVGIHRYSGGTTVGYTVTVGYHSGIHRYSGEYTVTVGIHRYSGNTPLQWENTTKPDTDPTRTLYTGTHHGPHRTPPTHYPGTTHHPTDHMSWPVPRPMTHRPGQECQKLTKQWQMGA